MEDDGLTKAIQVVPLHLGTVPLDVYVSFADGGLSVQTVQVNVQPGYTGVKAFRLDEGFSIVPLQLTAGLKRASIGLLPKSSTTSWISQSG